jgi:hypothetical protein
MNDEATVADARNILIERSFDLAFGYRATFISRRPDEPFEVRRSSEQPRIRNRARCEIFLRPTKRLGASSSKMSPMA